MTKRRSRCECGDLFSEHDWRSQNSTITDPCIGQVCTAMGRLRERDYCDLYFPESDHYRPLREVLADFGLTKQDVR